MESVVTHKHVEELMIEGETILSGAPDTCPECGVTPTLEVYRSNAGYYLGTYCNCGPYSRESGYYATEQEAQRDLNRQTQKAAKEYWKENGPWFRQRR